MVQMPLNRKSFEARLSFTPQPAMVAGSRSSIFPLPGESQFPSPPALSNALLQLELCLSASVVDLQDITNIIRGDIGLTAQLLRLAASELEESPSRVVPVSEIILQLGVNKLKAMMARTRPLPGDSANSAGSNACVRFWMHARLTALIAEELASRSSEVHPEEAYLAGLFYHLGDLPPVLGWTLGSDATSRHIGYRMAKAWGFPQTLVDVIAGDRELALGKSRVLLDTAESADGWASRLRFLATREGSEARLETCLVH
jgi:HD-like signal output (HDOD) protein